MRLLALIRNIKPLKGIKGVLYLVIDKQRIILIF
jgi:hypothetical protein